MNSQIRKPLLNHTSSLPYLIMKGMDCLAELADEGQQAKVSFRDWAPRMMAGLADDQCDKARIEWLWNTLCSNPDVRLALGSRLAPIEDDWKKLPAVEAAPSESQFAIYLNVPHSISMGYPASLSGVSWDAVVILDEPLIMRPGRGRRFACEDASCTLVLTPPKVGTVAEEAAAMKVDEAAVRIEDGHVFVSVRSLNHAYTKASLRLEPDRRGPGGRAYDHMALIKDDEPRRKYISLETLRCQAEEKALQSLAEDSMLKGCKPVGGTHDLPGL